MGVAVPNGSYPIGNNPFFLARGRAVHPGIVCKEQYDWAKTNSVAKQMGFYGIYTFGSKAIIIDSPELVIIF